MTRSRYLVASFLAPGATLLVPALLALAELNADVLPLPDGSFDDASIRVAGTFLLVVLPVAYVIVATYYAASGHLLARIGRLSFKAYAWFAVAAPWLLVLIGVIGLVSNNKSILGGLLILGIIGIAMSICSFVGAAVWWRIAVGRRA